MENWFMKKCCQHCPYNINTKPFLTTSRATELAYHAENPYNSFTCHKTTEADDDSEYGEMLITNDSKECAGFMAMQHNLNDNKLPEGFAQDIGDCFGDTWEMIERYKTHNDKD